MVLPLATLTAHSAIHLSLQAPPPHPSMALTPWMNLPARRALSVPPKLPTGPTRPLATMEEMSDLSPILPLLVN